MEFANEIKQPTSPYSVNNCKHSLDEQFEPESNTDDQENDSDDQKKFEYTKKCKDFDKYINFDFEELSHCCEFFVDATDNEIEYFATKFIEFGIENNNEIKNLGLIAHQLKTALLRARKLIADIVNSLEQEFKVLKQEKIENSLKLGNFAKFIGELYVSRGQLIPSEFMTNFLTFLKTKKKFLILKSTLKQCGYIYKQRNGKDFKILIESLPFGPLIKDEIEAYSKSFDDKDQILQSRLFKPSELAIIKDKLDTILYSIGDGKDVDFDYNIEEILNVNTRRLFSIVIKILQKQDADVIKLAQFLKTFNDFSYKIGNFIHKLKFNLKLKIIKMSVYSLKEMKAVGKLTAELVNLSVTNDVNQNLWQEKVQNLNPFENLDVLEIYVDVIKSMLINIHNNNYEKLHDIHKYLKDINVLIESENTPAAPRIKSKITQLIQNIILKNIDYATSELLFKIKLGHKIQGLPKAMPEHSLNFIDIHDFATLFYLNAISNQHFTANYAYAIKDLQNGPNGEKFIQFLREILFFNLIPNTFAPECELDEVPGTFDLICYLFKGEVLTELNVAAFLETLVELENFERYNIFVEWFMKDLKTIVRADNQKLKESIAKVEKKLKEQNYVIQTKAKPSKHEMPKTQNKMIQNSQKINNSASSGQNNSTPGTSTTFDPIIQKQNQLSLKSASISQKQPKVESKSPKKQRKSNKVVKIASVDSNLSDNLQKGEQTQTTENNLPSTSTSTLPSSKESNHFIPKVQRPQNSWKEISDILKKSHIDLEDDYDDSIIYDKLYIDKPFNTQKYATKEKSRKLNVKFSLEELIKPTRVKDKTDKLPTACLTGHQNPEVMNFYNEMLPKMTSSIEQFKKCAKAIYDWKINDSVTNSEVKELIGLLAKELQANHKQLLTDVSIELANKCDVLRRFQGSKKQKKDDSFLQDKSAFILNFKATALFLEKLQVYENLHTILSYIRDGNRIAFDLLVDIAEGIENIFIVNCKERNGFVPDCIDALEYAENFKNTDEDVLDKTTRLIAFLKSLNIKREVLQIELKFESQVSKNIVSTASKKQKKQNKPKKLKSVSQLPKKPALVGHSSHVAQSNGKTSQVKILSLNDHITSQSSNPNDSSEQMTKILFGSIASSSSAIIDPPVNFSTDAKVMFYVNQLQSSNIQKVDSAIAPFITNDAAKLRLIELLLEKGTSNPKYINPVIELLKISRIVTITKKCLRYMSEELMKHFFKLCKHGKDNEEKLSNLTNFTIKFENKLNSTFWFELWIKLIDLVKNDYPNSLKILLFLMNEKISLLSKITTHKKHFIHILSILRNKIMLSENKESADKMIFIMEAIERGLAQAKSEKRLKTISGSKNTNKHLFSQLLKNEENELKIELDPENNPNWIALQKQMKFLSKKKYCDVNYK